MRSARRDQDERGIAGRTHSVHVLPGVGHTLLVTEQGRIVGYPPSYLDSVVEWAAIHAGKSKSP